MIKSFCIHNWGASLLGLALLGVVCVTGAAISEPDPLRSRPDVAAWIKQADASPDKIEVWRKAAKEGNAFVKELVVEELVKLEDERGLAILQEFMDDGVPYSPDVPNYRSDARMAQDTIKDRLYWKKNVASKQDGPEKLDAARKALLCDRTGVRQMAFRYLRASDEPEKVVKTALDSYDKLHDSNILELIYDVLQEHKAEGWVVPHLTRIRDQWDTMSPIAREYNTTPMAADWCLRMIDADKKWNELNAKAHTPAEKKAVALQLLTEARNVFLQPRAIDYLITLDDEDLIPVWVQGILMDRRIPEKLVKLGKKAVPELIRFLDVNYDSRGDDFARAEAAMQVLVQLKEKSAVPLLTRLLLLSDKPGRATLSDLRYSARVALQGFGQDGIRALTKVLNESTNEHSVIEAATGLSCAGGQAEIQTLKARLDRERAKGKPSESIVEEIQSVSEGLARRLRSGEDDKR